MENKKSERRHPDVLERDTWGYAVCFGTIITFVSVNFITYYAPILNAKYGQMGQI